MRLKRYGDLKSSKHKTLHQPAFLKNSSANTCTFEKSIFIYLSFLVIKHFKTIVSRFEADQSKTLKVITSERLRAAIE